eukprot:5669419-Alexandrium_andersonii.AAC.1
MDSARRAASVRLARRAPGSHTGTCGADAISSQRSASAPSSSASPWALPAGRCRTRSTRRSAPRKP